MRNKIVKKIVKSKNYVHNVYNFVHNVFLYFFILIGMQANEFWEKY